MRKAYTPNIKSNKGKNLTKYVAQFVKKNKYNSIPKNVVKLAKKHILDGFGLALSGSVARTGEYLFKHIKQNSDKINPSYWWETVKHAIKLNLINL